MAVSQTTRLNIYRWSAGTDAFTRAQMDASHEELEDRVAGYSQAASRPAAALAYKGFFHYSTTGQLSYCNGTAWDDIAVENTTDGNIGEIDGTASAGTSASGLAYAEHKHSIAANAITSGNIVSLDAAKLTGTLSADRIASTSIADAKIADLDASKLTGSLSLDTSGNAATAGDATNSTNVNVLADNSSSTAYLLFATDTGNTRARRDTDLSYNASTNTLTVANIAANVTGNLTGTASDATNATNATNVNVYADNTSTTVYPLFATGTGNTQARRDTGLSYNASSNTLTTTTFSGALSGNASSADEVSVLSVSTNATHYVTFADTTTGTDRARIDTTLTYNPSTNVLGGASTKFTGASLSASSFVESGGSVNAGNGSASVPSFNFSGDTDTGMYRSTTNELSFATNGAQRVKITSAGTLIWINSSGIGGPLTDTSSTSGFRYVLQNQAFGTLQDYTSIRDRKEQITNVTAADSGRWIDALQPVTYIERWLGGGTEPEDSREFREADVQVGFIADDVLANANTSLFAQVVDDGRGGLDPAGWKWECVIAAAVAEIKSLRARVASLEA